MMNLPPLLVFGCPDISNGGFNYGLIVMNQRDIKTNYLAYLEKLGSKPGTVRLFTRAMGFEEQDFYDHFPSVDALEADIWKDVADFAIKVITDRSDYEALATREKIKVLMYTIFNIMVGSRGFVLSSVENGRLAPDLLTTYESMRSFRETMMKFIDLTIDQAIQGGEALQATYLGGKSTDILWLQFSVVFKNWLTDTSEGYLDTVSAIEGGVEYAFERLRENPDDAAQHFVNFLRRKSN